MKRLLCGLIIILLLLLLVSCGAQEKSASEANPDGTTQATEQTEDISETKRTDKMVTANETSTTDKIPRADEITAANKTKIPEDAKTPKKNAFNFETKTVTLNSGYEMPLMGLGTYSLDYDTCVASVTALLNSGGRLIDTAYMYHNEDAVGFAVRTSDVPREEIFVTTKLYPNQYHDAASAIDDALEKTGLEYIDLMLLHHPGTNDVEAYRAMEQAVKDGKIRSIGLSNWYIEELETFLPQITIMPSVVQNEIHPYYQEIDVVPYIQELGIVAEGWYPFGGRGYTKEILGNEAISAIAAAHDVTSAQVILRWNLQRGVVVIPGSGSPEHIAENLDIFGFELTEDEMEQIKSLNRDEKHDWY